jgi:hypothetical protein
VRNTSLCYLDLTRPRTVLRYISMPEAKTYTGGCHCGAVRYEVTTDLEKTMMCNCSLCGRAGWILVFAPAEQFTLMTGQDALTDYQFNKKIIHHPFCKHCGVRSFSRSVQGSEHPSVAVNVRCLDDVDVSTLQPTLFDGKSI